MNNNKITPSLWFISEGGSMSAIVTYYKNVFGNDFDQGNIVPLGKTPSGNTEMCQAKIFGQSYSFLCTASEHHQFNDALSFTINCEDQHEIDMYWDYFTREGKESQCGWCQDKYGLRWQVVPKNLGELMNKPNGFKVLMSQKKIVIEKFLS